MIMNTWKKKVLVPGLILLLATCALSQETALNEGFEMQNWSFWTETGNVPSWERFVLLKDVTGPGVFGWAYGQKVYTGSGGGLEQTIFLQAGVTYRVSVDICYTVC